MRISKIYFECEDNEEITILIKEMHNKNFQFICSKLIDNFKGEPIFQVEFVNVEQ